VAVREATDLPIVLKGILHPDDARRAQEAGMSGVIVSNHGGRQVDGAVGALDALVAVREAVPDLDVFFDSGVRCAADVVKALALGARAVLVGRPYVWALGVGGEDGVAELLRNWLAELDLTLALTGNAHVDGLDRSALVPAGGAT
jgi:isopentenyl diphosphate isomerase/L-lactate dehydrogenase-like FMN-dependent dehydrogenase